MHSQSPQKKIRQIFFRDGTRYHNHSNHGDPGRGFTLLRKQSLAIASNIEWAITSGKNWSPSFRN